MRIETVTAGPQTVPGTHSVPGTLSLAEIGALVGEPGRANMLSALFDGGALTATELAYVARVSPSTASEHLARLTAGGLLKVVRQGRHRFYRLASPLVAAMLESMMVVAAIDAPPRRRRVSGLDAALKAGRTCYDHLAGELGVAIADAMVARGYLVLGEDAGELTAEGRQALSSLGVSLDGGRSSGRGTFCRPCLDWSERRPHLAGRLGAGLAARCFELGWIRRAAEGRRAVVVTPRGREGLCHSLGLRLV